MISHGLRIYTGFLFSLLVANPVSSSPYSHPLTDSIDSVIADWITYGFIFVALLFIIYMVWNLAQAQFASFMNVPRMHALAMEQAGISILLLAVAASARPITHSIAPVLTSAGGDFNSIQHLLVTLAEFALSLILGLVIAVTILSAIWSIVRIQGNVYMGRPGGLSLAVTNLVSILFGGIAVLLSLPLSNWILSQVIK
jgi:hypothetical protein